MHTKYFTPQELEIIKINYPLYGQGYCAKILNRTDSDRIGNRARYMGLRSYEKMKHESLLKIPLNQFKDIVSTEVAWFLGFLWADGTVCRSGYNHIVQLEILSSDAQDIMPIMNAIGQWNIYTRMRPTSINELTNFKVNSKELYNFLNSFDYPDKSHIEPTKILEHIPTNLHNCFWRGFFDGDGHCSISTPRLPSHKKRYKSISFTGPYEYAFSSLKNMLIDIGISDFVDYRYINPKKGYKLGRISIRKKIDILCQYLLSCPIGLSRKTAILGCIP